MSKLSNVLKSIRKIAPEGDCPLDNCSLDDFHRIIASWIIDPKNNSPLTIFPWMISPRIIHSPDNCPWKIDLDY